MVDLPRLPPHQRESWLVGVISCRPKPPTIQNKFSSMNQSIPFSIWCAKFFVRAGSGTVSSIRTYFPALSTFLRFRLGDAFLSRNRVHVRGTVGVAAHGRRIISIAVAAVSPFPGLVDRFRSADASSANEQLALGICRPS